MRFSYPHDTVTAMVRRCDVENRPFGLNKNDAGELAASITKVFSARPFTVFSVADNGGDVSSNVAQLAQARQANEQKNRNNGKGGRRYQASRKGNNNWQTSPPY